jgi:hypothetical protein
LRLQELPQTKTTKVDDIFIVGCRREMMAEKEGGIGKIR